MKFIRKTNLITSKLTYWKPTLNLIPATRKEADIGLAALPQNDGQVKLRPILLLKKTSGFGDFIVCGISTNLRHQQIGLDEMVVPDDENHLKQTSLIRLTYLHTISPKYIRGTIGKIPTPLHAELLKRLAAFFEPTN